MADRVTEALLAALRQALAEPSEQRLFRSGKLSGLFPNRSGVHATASAQALRAGLLEVVRTETRGKTTIDWVRLTPRGVDFLHEHESPLCVLKELQRSLQTAQNGVPIWLAEMRSQLGAMGNRLAEDSQRMLRELEALRQRVAQTLKHLESAAPQLSDSLAALVPWGMDALHYLERRRLSGAVSECTLPELFTAVAEKHAPLSIAAFHDGLCRLHDHRVLRLLPFTASPAELPQPEYALLKGSQIFYYAARQGVATVDNGFHPG